MTNAQSRLAEIYLPDIVGGGYGTMWRSKSRYIAIKGSRRSKKSKTQALKLIYQIIKYPLSNALVVRRYYNTLKDSCFTELKWAIRRLGLETWFKVKESPLEITYIPTGQKIYFRGLDDSLKITSITCEVGAMCFLWVEEAYEIESESEFDKLCESMMGDVPLGHFRQITLTFNPWSESTWLKKRFFDNPSQDVLAITTNYLCNEWLSDADKAEFERMRVQQPARYRVSGLGEWGVDGATYFEEFDKSVHVVTPFAIPDHWRIYRSLDYGLDATACLYIAVDTAGVAYVISEVYKSNLIISASAREIIANEPRADRYSTYAPPDLWGRTKDTGITIADGFREAGVPLIKADNARVAGWMQVHERLKVIEDADGGKTARLKIFATCRNLIRCISTIKADEDNCNDCATEPHELTHLCDSLRYFCVSRPLAAREIDERGAEERMLANYKESLFAKNKKVKVYR